MKKKDIPFVGCDRCIAIKEAIEKKDFKKYCELRELTESVTKAEKYLDEHKNDLLSDECCSTDQFLTEIHQEFNTPIKYELPSKCPFDFKPNLKIPIRRKYKLKCSHCNQSFGCPACVVRMNKRDLPICLECIPDSEPDYNYQDLGDY